MSKFLRWVVAFLYFFCHANAKLAPRHWTKIVLENIANSRFRFYTVGPLLYHYNSGGSGGKRELAIFSKKHLVQCLGASFAFT